MTALRVIFLAIGYIAGVSHAVWLDVELSAAVWFTAGLTGAVWTGLCMYREHQWHEPRAWLVALAALLLAFPAGYSRTRQKLQHVGDQGLAALIEQMAPGDALILEGHISREPEVRSAAQLDLRVQVDAVRTGNSEDPHPVRPGAVMLRLYDYSPEPAAIMNAVGVPAAYGYRVRAVVRPELPEEMLNPGQFDLRAFLLQNDLHGRFRLHASNLEILEQSRGNLVVELALAIKERFLRTYRLTVSSPASRLVAAATLGSRRAVERQQFKGMEITEMFRHAGVGHVLAVSGLHVSVVAFLLYALLRFCRLRPKAAAPLAIAALILFAILTGARPSSVRAAIMNSVILIAFSYFRFPLRKATAIGLAASALLILGQNPLVLFSPGFLLSFGAVLSLILFSPPLDRWLCSLRGFCLFLFLLWFFALVLLVCYRLDWLLSWPAVLGVFGLLWFLLRAGLQLNRHYPAWWRVGFERLPKGLRLFLAAQLAIQIGMMIPLSAWFFGQFPVAGIFVNLFAIPAVGILVQLGMLGGLAGLLPGIGVWLALPFGVANTIVGELFFRIAHTGAVWFPFPATPRPSPVWMTGYYLFLAVVLLLDARRSRLQGYVYAAARRWGRGWSRLSLVPVLAALAAPLLLFRPAPEPVRQITCYATGRHPAVSLAGRRGRGLVINPGNRFSASSVMFHALRGQGVVRLRDVLLPGPHPDAGAEGVPALAAKLPIERLHLGVLPQHADELLEEIGDRFLLAQAACGEAWALAYHRAHTSLMAVAADREVEMRVLTEKIPPVPDWPGVDMRVLEMCAEPVAGYQVSAMTRLLWFDVWGFGWLVISDALPDHVLCGLEALNRPVDVVVLPELSSRAAYPELLETVMAKTGARVMIVTSRRPPRETYAEDWARERPHILSFFTYRDGAVKALQAVNGVLRLQGHFSGRTAEIPVTPKRYSVVRPTASQ